MKYTKPEIHDSSKESVSGTVTVSESKQTTPSVPTEVKDTEQESKLNELTKLVQMLIDEKINSDQKTQESNSNIQKAESSKSVDSSKISQDSKPKVQSTGSSKSLRSKPIQKPQLKCELCHYTNHSTDDCYRILYCMKCKREDHRTSDHEMYIALLKRSENYKAVLSICISFQADLESKGKAFPTMHTLCRVIQIRGGVLAESSQSNESSIRVKCNTCGSTVHSTSDHNEFDHFKRETHQGAHLLPRQWMLKEYDWCQELSAQICRETSQLCDAKYIVQFDDKQGTIFNANKEIVLMAPRRNDVYVLDMSSLTPNGACFFAKASESINWLWHKRLSHLNFKNINKLAKQNNVLGLPSLVYSKDKPCTTCEKGSTIELHSKLNKSSPLGSVCIFFIWTCLDQERILDISYFYVFGCPVFIYNHKDHLGKFDAKADDGYFLGYSSISKAFRVYNTRRQQINETYHVTFDESIEAIMFTNTSVDEIRINDSSRYPPDEFQEDDPSSQYQVDSDVLYYIIPHGRSLTEITQENHVPAVIAANEPEIPHTEDDKGPPDPINIKGTHEEYVQNDQMITQPTDVSSGNGTGYSLKDEKRSQTRQNRARI
ncbi:retrovirus-related pol polyprotein from transposon TNT 1-94 [Tanacetum coccineum]